MIATMVDPQLLPAQLIAARAMQRPDDVIVAHVDGRTLSYAGIHQANLAWAGAYRALGVERGAHVLTMLPTSLDAYHAWLGLAWLGGVEVSLNTAYRGRILQYVIAQSGAAVMVVSSQYVERLAEVWPAIPNPPSVVVADSDDVSGLPIRAISRSEFLAAPPWSDDQRGPAVHDVACMIFTSGTTGPSKGVLVPWGQMYYGALGPPADALFAGESYYSTFPTYHMSGKYSLYIPLMRDGRLVLRDTFSVGQFWDDIRSFDCVYTTVVGAMPRFLLMQPAREDDARNPLRGVTAAPLSPEIEEFKKRFDLKVTTGFGMTEVGGILGNDWETINWRSCGKVRRGPPGYEVRLVDEYDQPVADGEFGELIVRTDEPWALNCGYHRMPEKTAEAWRNGWFHTGDVFVRDGDGYFYFVDRLKDCIRRRGENISSMEVEAYVQEHPDVLECAAIGVPSEYSEDEVKICVVAKAGASLTCEQLIEFLTPRMPRFMLPRYVELVGELPKTEATNRIKKSELKKDPLNDNTWDRESPGR
jgi:crotonobetaine/carnitine-CoA ligase